jgi:hypothetical protein
MSMPPVAGRLTVTVIAGAATAPGRPPIVYVNVLFPLTKAVCVYGQHALGVGGHTAVAAGRLAEE